ncbi:hypothetical protein J2W97_005231 [Paenibacillus jamilae]|nr:hypothetical protein [Paenibacillus jamilae]
MNEETGAEEGDTAIKDKPHGLVWTGTTCL